jgi:hypothetical protein
MNKMKRMRRKIPTLQINVKPGASYSQLKEHPTIKKLVIESLVDAVADGIKNKKNQVALFEIAGCEYQVMINKSEWKSSLETAINHFLESEDYDACVCCRDLINKIK